MMRMVPILLVLLGAAPAHAGEDPVPGPTLPAGFACSGGDPEWRLTFESPDTAIFQSAEYSAQEIRLDTRSREYPGPDGLPALTIAQAGTDIDPVRFLLVLKDRGWCRGGFPGEFLFEDTEGLTPYFGCCYRPSEP